MKKDLVPDRDMVPGSQTTLVCLEGDFSPDPLHTCLIKLSGRGPRGLYFLFPNLPGDSDGQALA